MKCTAIVLAAGQGKRMKSKCELDEQQIISEMLKDVRESVLFNNNEEILKKWKTVDVNQKQSAADEFFERYNTNHFTDLLKN